MKPIHIAEDTIDSQDINRLVDWLQTYPRLTQGKVVKEFEHKWGKWLRRDHSVFVNSGSSANLLMYQTLLSSGMLKNKKVIVPSTGWPTSITPAIQLGFEPIMCDTDPITFGLDLDHLQELLEEHDAATVLLVQVLGVPHKMKQVMQLKEKYGFILLEDACAAIGSETFSKKLGTFGDMSSFSFYFGHQMSTIEGGMVSCNAPLFYNKLIKLRSHGWDKEGNQDPDAPFNFVEPGYNLRSTDLNAFIGIFQLYKISSSAKKRHQNYLRYRVLLRDDFGIQTCLDPDAIVSNIHFAIVAESKREREIIITALRANLIENRAFTAANLGRHPFWVKRYGVSSLPNADKLYERSLYLPNHPSMTSDDLERICKVVLAVKRAPSSQEYP